MATSRPPSASSRRSPGASSSSTAAASCSWLLERDLVDEVNLRIYPVIVGDGLRLFPERGQTHTLELVESRSLPSGVMLQTYRPAGRATFGNAGD